MDILNIRVFIFKIELIYKDTVLVINIYYSDIYIQHILYKKMVKNLGGNKSKKQARKGVVLNTASSQKVRYIEEDGEMYAVVTTIFGGKFCQVMCNDGVSRRCTIRRKFMMSRKGDNAIAVGTWVMVGLYDWEKRSDGTQTCDILEVYSMSDKDKLKQTVNAITLKHIIAINNTFEGNTSGNELLFSDTLVDDEDVFEKEEDVFEKEDDDDINVNDNDNDNDSANSIADAIANAHADSNKKESVQEQNDWMNVDENDI